MKHPRIEKMGQYWTKTNKIACERCGKPWGIESEWNGQLELPVLKIDGFRFVDPADPNFLSAPRQWSSACFIPDVVHCEDVLESFFGNDNEQH